MDFKELAEEITSYVFSWGDCKESNLHIETALRSAYKEGLEAAANCIVVDGNPAIALEKIRNLKDVPHGK